MAINDILNRLTGGQRDAAAAVIALFSQYGLESLASKIVDYIRQGYAADTVTLLLQESPEYKRRFAANETRRRLGLPILSPREYVETENAYRRLMVAAGLPVGFYDRPSDFQSFLERDISPQEVGSRIEAAKTFIDRADSSELAYYRQYYTKGDLIAFALDPKRAEPLVGKAFRAAAVGGQAAAQGININRAEAESLAGLGVDSQEARQGFSLIATEQDNAAKLAALEGQTLTVQELIDETFRADADAAKKRRKLGEKEQARFGGSSGASSGALSRDSSGSY